MFLFPYPENEPRQVHAHIVCVWNWKIKKNCNSQLPFSRALLMTMWAGTTEGSQMWRREVDTTSKINTIKITGALFKLVCVYMHLAIFHYVDLLDKCFHYERIEVEKGISLRSYFEETQEKKNKIIIHFVTPDRHYPNVLCSSLFMTFVKNYRPKRDNFCFNLLYITIHPDLYETSRYKRQNHQNYAYSE